MIVENPVYIRVGDVAKLCSICKTTVWKLVKEEKLKTYKLTGGITLFKRDEVLEYFNSLASCTKTSG